MENELLKAAYALEEPMANGRVRVSASDVVTLLRRQRETFLLVFLNCCNAAAVGDEETTGKYGFGDVALKILKMGVPHVVGLHGLGGIGKTYLCSRMQQRVLFYAVPAKRLNKSSSGTKKQATIFYWI